MKQNDKTKNCYKKTKVFKDVKTGGVFASAYACNQLECELCAPKIQNTLRTKILFAAEKYNMNQFLTLTTSEDYEVLEADFAGLRKILHYFQKENYIKKHGPKAYKEYIKRAIDFEIKTMFYIRFLKEIAVKIAQREKISYMRLKDKALFIDEHYNEIIAYAMDKLQAFKADKIQFTPIIKGEPRLFKQYKDLYDYCRKQITQNEDEKFLYIRVLEIAGKSHFHILCNKYVSHYLIGRLYQKGEPVVGKAKNIYLNKDLLSFTDFETQIAAKEAVAKYVTLYITSDLAKTINNYKKATKSRKKINIINASEGINVSFQDTDSGPDKGTYEFKGAFAKVPRSSWEQIPKGDIGTYMNHLKRSEDIHQNEYIKALYANYDEHIKHTKALEREYAPLIAEASIAEVKALKWELKQKREQLYLQFQEAKNYYETLLLKAALDSKLNKLATHMSVSDSYMKELIKRTEATDLPPEEKHAYYSAQMAFIEDLKDRRKNIIFLLGSAGSGKTSTIAELKKHTTALGRKTEYCALSAKAASVLQDKGLPAKTIHRLCGAKYSAISNFSANEYYPLDCDIVYVDEVSMISKLDFGLLLNALPHHAKIILVGDEAQLNPVGSNNIIYELGLLNHPNVGIHRLNINFRSEDEIALTANKVRAGNLSGLQYKPFDMGLIQQKIKDGYQIITNGRVLSDKINLCACRDNKDITGLAFYNYKIGQSVMICRNDVRAGVYNGNTCTILGYDPEDQNKVMLRRRDGTIIKYSREKSSDHFKPSHSFTIHKSQGSEFDKVCIVLDNKSLLLNRNLIYTAITRAKVEFEIYIVNGVDIIALYEAQENEDKYTISNIKDYLTSVPKIA